MIFPGQAVDGVDIERSGAVTLDVAKRHEDFERFILDGFARQAEEGFEHIVGILPISRGFAEFRVVLALRVIDEEIFPDIEVAGYVRLAVLIETKARGEQHHIGVAAEHGAGGTGSGDFPSNRLVEALQTFGLAEIIFGRTVDAR